QESPTSIRRFVDSPIVNPKKKGTRERPLSCGQRSYLFFAAFFLPPLAFFAIEDVLPSLVGLRGQACCRRTLPPGTSARREATSLRGLTPARRTRRGRAATRAMKRSG